MNIQDLVKRIKQRKVHQIRSGKKHRFIDITIITVGNRLFVRPYKFGEKGWYEAFLEHPEGEIRIGDVVVPIEGKIPHDLEEINPQVSRSTHRFLPIIYFLMRLTFDTKKHEARTLEIIPISKLV